MYDDPVVERVRNIRREIEAECHHDADQYLEHLQEVQQQYEHRLVCGESEPTSPQGDEPEG